VAATTALDGLGIGDSIILNINTDTQEMLTIKAFGSIIVNEPLRHDHVAGEPITLFKKAENGVGTDDPNSNKNVDGAGTQPSNNGATVAIIVVVVVVVLLVAGGGVATFFILKMRRENSSGGGAMKIGPRGNGRKAITVVTTDDMNSPTY